MPARREDSVTRATERMGTEGDNDPGAHGLWEVHEGAHGLQEGPLKWYYEISTWGLKTFFFGDHLISAGKTVRISVKTFSKRHFLRMFWSSHKRKSVIFELSPGPRSSLGAPERDWGTEMNFGGTRSLSMWIRERGSNEKGEDPKKRSSVQKFPQTLVFISKFLRFSANPKVKTKKRSSVQKCPQIFVVILRFSTNSKLRTKKKGLRPQHFIKSGVNSQKLRKNSSCSRILGR